MELIRHELYKIYSNKSVIILFIVITIFSGIYFAGQVHYGKVDSKVKSSIINELEGKITNDKVLKAAEELKLLSNQMHQQSIWGINTQLLFKTNIYSRYGEMNNAYWMKKQQVSKIDLSKKGDEGFAYKNNKLLFKMTKATMIKEFRYTAGWDDIVNYVSKFGAVIMAAFILLGLSSVFCGEYASKMDAILLSSKYGKTKLIRAKLVAALIYILAMIALFTMLNLIGNILVFGTQGWNAPMQCLFGYQYSPYSFTVIQFYLLQLLLHSMACVTFGLFVLLVSSLSRTRILTFFIGVFVFVGPFIIDNAIPMKKNLAELATKFSISWFMQVEKLFYSYRTYDIMDNPVLYPVVATCLFVIVAVFSCIYIKRTFQNHGMNF